MVGLHVDNRRVTITTHRSGISSTASIKIFIRKPLGCTGPKRLRFQTPTILQCGGFICRVLWRRAEGILQLPAGYFGCSLMFIFQNYGNQSLDRRRRLIGMKLGTRFFIYGMDGSEVCCKYPRQYVVLHRMQKSLEFGKACCHFACASVGSTFALLASFYLSARRAGRPRHTRESKLQA